MKLLKKFGLIVFTFIIVFSAAGCKKDAPAPVAEPTETEKFIAENGESLAETFEKGFATSGTDCEATLSAEGNTVTFDINIAGINNLDEDSKKELQSNFELTKEQVKSSFEGVTDEVPGLKKLIFNMNEEDGDKIASVDFDF